MQEMQSAHIWHPAMRNKLLLSGQKMKMMKNKNNKSCRKMNANCARETYFNAQADPSTVQS